jgi:hypothetical protein
MALRTIATFAAGVATGWVARSTLGSSRELLVRAVVVSHQLRDGMRRILAEQVEWAEDMFAEGRARYEATRVEAPLEQAPPPVVQIEGRGRAA